MNYICKVVEFVNKLCILICSFISLYLWDFFGCHFFTKKDVWQCCATCVTDEFSSVVR